MPISTKPPRALWIDALRGLAIFLVMVWHALVIGDDQRVQHGPLWETSVALQGMRMPTLFFLSGLLLPRALDKAAGSYVFGKWANLLWPYLVWQCIALLQDPDLSLLRLGDWGPHNYLWFMFYLMVYFTVALILRWMPPAATLAIAVFVFAAISAIAEEGSQPMRFGIYAVWFFAGATIGRSLTGRQPGFTWNRGLALGCFIAAASATIGYAGVPVNPEANPYVFLYVSVPTTAAAVVGTLIFANHRLFAPLQWVGRHSVVFYTAHFPIQVFIILALVDTEFGGAPAAVLAFFTSAMVCVLLAALRDTRFIGALFSFPISVLPTTLRGRLRARQLPQSANRSDEPMPSRLSR